MHESMEGRNASQEMQEWKNEGMANESMNPRDEMQEISSNPSTESWTLSIISVTLRPAVLRHGIPGLAASGQQCPLRHLPKWPLLLRLAEQRV